MNNIRRLKAENAAHVTEITALKTGIRELMGYLSSEKFYKDTTVQCSDVIQRLFSIESCAMNSRLETENEYYEPFPKGVEISDISGTEPKVYVARSLNDCKDETDKSVFAEVKRAHWQCLDSTITIGRVIGRPLF